MELSLTERQQASLAALSAQTGRSTADLLGEALDRMLAQEDWFAAQVQVGIDQIARGEFLEEEEMDERVARMLRP
jgi:predicted transcriptional regulator